VQVRSYPLAHGGLVAAAGWEHVLGLDLADQAPRVAAEALELLERAACPEGVRTIVLHGEQVGLQIHESIGHALELDRIQLGEASYAGTSFVAVEDLGRLRYGSEHLTITADATLPGGLGTFGWDDEGVPATATRSFDGGCCAAALTHRESAAAAGPAAVGRLRAGGGLRAPADRPHDERQHRAPAAPARSPTCSPTPRTACTSRRTARGRSTSAACSSSSPRRSPARSAAASSGACTATRPTPGSRRASGDRSTPCAARGVAALGADELRQGRAGQVMAVSHGAAPARFRDVQVGVA
jgi:TldD protein